MRLTLAERVTARLEVGVPIERPPVAPRGGVFANFAIVVRPD